MLFTQTGDSQKPTIILLHGGGLSDWSWQPVASLLQPDYHVITPIIDGHGADGKTAFTSIEASASTLIRYIDTHCGGTVFALAGLSIGAQIAVEVLSQRPDIAWYAIIESALVYPIKGTTALTAPSYGLFYGLIAKRWFAKLQAKSLCVPDHLFETYYQDSLQISKQSLINITLSNGTYALKNTISHTTAKVLLIVGSKELGIMKKSAHRLHDCIKNSELYIAKGMKHGEMSLVHTADYARLLKAFIKT